jgi:hypothetical protein
MNQWWQLDVKEILGSLSSDLTNGLSVCEAAERLEKYGTNELHAAHRILPWTMLLTVVDMGFDKGSINYTVIESWMTHRPPAKLLSAWLNYTQGLCESFSEEEKKNFCKKIVYRATAIAESSEGFLGLGNKISKAEQEVRGTLKTALKNDKPPDR